MCYYLWEEYSKQSSNENTHLLFSTQACNLTVFSQNVELKPQITYQGFETKQVQKI